MRTTASLEETPDLRKLVSTRAQDPVINTNKLHATLCILLSATVSVSTIIFLIRTFL